MSELDQDFSLVNDRNYFQSIRNSGYKSTSKAIAELIDNAIQAGATNVSISFEAPKDPDSSKRKARISRVFIRDNGRGMDRLALREGLRVGGSARFGDQAGLGRFGMGLKNASFSQCRRIEVLSWQGSGTGLYSYLDIDEIAAGNMKFVPRPSLVANEGLPKHIERPESCGTVVIWDKCDRLDADRIATTVASELRDDLGQVFRKFLVDGALNLVVDGTRVDAFDPLFHDRRCEFNGAQIVGERSVDLSGLVKGQDGYAIVRVAVLPEDWQRNEKTLDPQLQHLIEWRHKYSVGFSVLRLDREVDRGLFRFRKPHWADRWWAGEICFAPELDEVFGITNTKQQVNINPFALERLKAAIARVLGAATNQITERGAKHCSESQVRAAEVVASEFESRLGGTPKWLADKDEATVRQEIEQFVGECGHIPDIKSRVEIAHEKGQPFVVAFENRASDSFFRPCVVGHLLVLIVNRDHSFYHRLVHPLTQSEKTTGVSFELLLAAFVKAHVMIYPDSSSLMRLAEKWGECLATYLTADILQSPSERTRRVVEAIDT